MSDLKENLDSLIEPLPDPESARRFIEEFSEKYPSRAQKLLRNSSLLSDVLVVTSYSNFIAATLLQHPNYLKWLDRQRAFNEIKKRDELLESLGQFALTHSSLETNVMLARFRRRELIRIYLRDIFRQDTIAETTEEISVLADVILEYALRVAEQEIDNRYGIPLENDENQRSTRARFCIVALGKLGSLELNYSSDIDLLFIYSENGSTSGTSTRESTSNKQYFVKLAERLSQMVGEQTGEGAAYRVDTRLRPYGSVGALTNSLQEICRYYQSTARTWEKQMLIRARPSAGDEQLFEEFYSAVLPSIYSDQETVSEALENVRRSKEEINQQKTSIKRFDVKLGTGGIREIEFIAQALQLAFGGADSWLRAPHTLISLSRLADRRLITEQELTHLFEAYYFLRQVEHHLQMENGLQTHFVPNSIDRRDLLARKMGFDGGQEFEIALHSHTKNVHSAFRRIFGRNANESAYKTRDDKPDHSVSEPNLGADITPIITSVEKSDVDSILDEGEVSRLEIFTRIAPPFAERLASNPELIAQLPDENDEVVFPEYDEEFKQAVEGAPDYASRLSRMRRLQSKFLAELITFDVFEKIDLKALKLQQTLLADASIQAALITSKLKMLRDYDFPIEDNSLGTLGLGKMGSGGMDYDSDLDLILIYDDSSPEPLPNMTHAQFYSKAAEIFVTTLSSLTRDGTMYRVDLRLRPDGQNGATSIGKDSFYGYLESRAALWELLAYVKLRSIGKSSRGVGEKASLIIHKRALSEDPNQLRKETWRIRHRLENEKSKARRGKEIDIKFGEGGLQDVYFAVRYLQLRDDVPDSTGKRSTQESLIKLLVNGSINNEVFEAFSNGYKFLNLLDHQLRLNIGRSTIFPLGKKGAIDVIASRMKVASQEALIRELTAHRLLVRDAFEQVIDEKP